MTRPAIDALPLLGGHPVLDFVNTVDNRVTPTAESDALQSYGDLLAWSVRAGVLSEDEAAPLRESARLIPATRLTRPCCVRSFCVSRCIACSPILCRRATRTSPSWRPNTPGSDDGALHRPLRCWAELAMARTRPRHGDTPPRPERCGNTHFCWRVIHQNMCGRRVRVAVYRPPETGRGRQVQRRILQEG